MKEILEINEHIRDNFKKYSGHSIQDNTILDNYVLASSDGINEAYIEIERNKNPHLYTGLKNSGEIDELGLLLNIPRREDEDDNTYLYRLMDWQLTFEKGNRTSIVNSILNLKYSANASYAPYTMGTGTGTVYIIPNEYTDENIKKSIEEVKLRLEDVSAPDSFIEYEIVNPKRVDLIFNLLTYEDSDIAQIKTNIEIKMKEYINSIKPGDYIKLIEITKIGLMEPNIKYFNVSDIKIEGLSMNEPEILQTSKDKFILNTIDWIVVEEAIKNVE